MKAERRQIREDREREEQQDSKICKSCETLKHQLEIANYEKKQLLDRLLEKPTPEPKPPEISKEALKPRNIPWMVRRQMLEEEDRAKAISLRRQQEVEKKAAEKASEAVIENKPAGDSIDELERELGVT